MTSDSDRPSSSAGDQASDATVKLSAGTGDKRERETQGEPSADSKPLLKGTAAEIRRSSAPPVPSGRPPIPGRNVLGVALLVLILTLLAIAAFFVFQPFLMPLVTAVVITTVCYPLYSRVLQLVGENRTAIASGITCCLVILAVFTPIVWFGWVLTSEAVQAQKDLSRRVGELEAWVDKYEDETDSLWHTVFYTEVPGTKDFDGNETPTSEGVTKITKPKKVHREWYRLTIVSLDRLLNKPPPVVLNDLGGRGDGQPHVDDNTNSDNNQKALPGNERPSGDETTAMPFSAKGLTNVARWVTRTLATVLAGVIGVMIKFLLMVFIMFYFFKDGPRIAESVKDSLPVNPEYQDKVIDKFQAVSRSILRGTLATAVIQGAVAAVTFPMFDLKGPFFWGALIAFTALIPVVGTAIVTLPLIIGFLIQGQLWQAGLFLVLAVIIANLDSLVRPLLLKEGLQLHPVWVLLAVLGGVGCFGAMGLILGPMVVVLLRTVLALLAEESKERIAGETA